MEKLIFPSQRSEYHNQWYQTEENIQIVSQLVAEFFFVLTSHNDFINQFLKIIRRFKKDIIYRFYLELIKNQDIRSTAYMSLGLLNMKKCEGFYFPTYSSKYFDEILSYYHVV